MARTRAFRENAVIYDLFPYPETETDLDPAVKYEPGIVVGGAGTTGYDGDSQNSAAIYLPYGQYSGYWYYRRYHGGAYSDHYLFYNESEWRLGVSADPPDEDFAYYATTVNGAWSRSNGASPAPVVQVPGVGQPGKASGRGWQGPWYRNSPASQNTTTWDFGVIDEPMLYTKNAVDLKTIGKTLFTPLTPAAWPDCQMGRSINLSAVPSRLRKGGTGDLGEYGKTMWFAYTVVPETSVPAGRWLGICGTLGSNGWVGRNYNQANWGMEAGWTVTAQNTSVAITADVTHLIVMRNKWVYVDGGAGDYCETSMWVDPTPAIHPAQSGPDESADLLDIKMKYWVTSGAATGGVRMNMSQNGKMGNFRIGETYFSAAPGQRGLES